MAKKTAATVFPVLSGYPNPHEVSAVSPAVALLRPTKLKSNHLPLIFASTAAAVLTPENNLPLRQVSFNLDQNHDYSQAHK